MCFTQEGRFIDMEILEKISIRGRVAYTICLFEQILEYYKCKGQEWKIVLEKLWTYTNIDFLDDWMYELAEYMPDSILEDTVDDCEFITIEEFNHLYNLYSKSCSEIKLFLKLIFEIGTIDLYSKLVDNSPNTIEKVKEAINILNNNNIRAISIEPFEKYSFNECNGWGKQFDGRKLSIFL